MADRPRLKLPRPASNCQSCGTFVTKGVIFCVACAVKNQVKPPIFNRELGNQKRPPYEKELPDDARS